VTARDRILDAAAEVLHRDGFVGATTKEIARAAGLSEAMIYKVFADKTDLFMGVLKERGPSIGVLADLDARTGKNLRTTLRTLAADLLTFYLSTFPMAASLFSDPELLVRHRAALRLRGAGPESVVAEITRWLEVERKAGRVAPVVPSATVADMLVGACFHRAFLVRFGGEPIRHEVGRRFAADTARAAEALLRPTG
jgi:AcrR family transcriptional regulator